MHDVLNANGGGETYVSVSLIATSGLPEGDGDLLPIDVVRRGLGA